MDGRIVGAASVARAGCPQTKLNAMFSRIEGRLLVDREDGRLHEDVPNLRRLAMLMNQLALGLAVGDQLRRKSGGTSKHELSALVDDLCGILERGLAPGG